MTAPLKILVIEDSEADFLLLERHLRQHGLSAACRRVASDAELAAALDEGGWDAAFADYVVPGMDFPATLALLKARLPDIPVILVSGSVGEETAAELLRLGVTDFVLKDHMLRLVPAVERGLREAGERRARRTAEAEAHRLSEALRQASQPMLLADPQARITYLNPAFTRLFGHGPGDLVGESVGRLCPADEANRALQAEMTRHVREGGAWSGEAIRLHRDGTPIHVHVSLGAVRDAAGGLTGFVGNYLDLRPLKEREQAIETYKRHLEDLVAARTARLEAMNREMASFTHAVSHNLHAPLRAIDGYSRLLERECAAALSEDCRQFVGNVRKGIGQMSALIEGLLSYARMERRELSVAPLDLAVAVGVVLEERKEEMRTLGIRVEADLPGIAAECPRVTADPEGLSMALRNLLDNAIKFTRGAAEPRIEIGAQAEGGDRCAIRVKDNGIGFDMRFHDRIFEVFQGLHGGDEYAGTGVGLAMVRKAAERMGGRVRAESAPGEGATFFLELPVSP